MKEGSAEGKLAESQCPTAVVLQARPMSKARSARTSVPQFRKRTISSIGVALAVAGGPPNLTAELADSSNCRCHLQKEDAKKKPYVLEEEKYRSTMKSTYGFIVGKRNAGISTIPLPRFNWN